MLVDEVSVKIKAGDGGAGIVSFGKFMRSGPDGGNGGKGGDVYLRASADLTLLKKFISKPEVAAADGGRGRQNKSTGADGADLYLELPIGSLIINQKTGEQVELERPGQEIFLLKGGEGGIGNFELRSSTNTTPKNTLPAKKGEIGEYKIILRFIADFGLIGLPSSGKSSLLNELTNARAKTASYHFTTLSPNLGVIKNPSKAETRIIADIPGLIEGASEGKGLGIKFLKHIQKVSLLLHCISADSLDPVADYKVIRKELGEFDKELLVKDEMILITRSDLASDAEVKKIKKNIKKLNKNILTTSIYDLESINALRKKLK